MATIWTIGHSSRTFEEFCDLLNIYNIQLLVDVRRYPGSRKFPHFNKDFLSDHLPKKNIGYEHLEDLGGRRKVDPNSVNTAWRLDSFKGYADYMATEEFKEALALLEKEARRRRVTYMCSEAVWWSCHRSLISDALKVKGWKVLHIMGEKNAPEHPYTQPAQIVDGQLSYAKEEK